jgi:hypothetical protein
MKGRCLSVTHRDFGNYGGRGIAICERWRDSFPAFYEDIGPRPSKRHSVDRIDNDGHYEPGNCRWATQSEQNNNQRRTIRVKWNGETLPLAVVCALADVPISRIRRRIQGGMSIEDAIAIPAGIQRNRKLCAADIRQIRESTLGSSILKHCVRREPRANSAR